MFNAILNFTVHRKLVGQKHMDVAFLCYSVIDHFHLYARMCHFNFRIKIGALTAIQLGTACHGVQIWVDLDGEVGCEGI